MKVVVDTNVWFSTLLNVNSLPAKVLRHIAIYHRLLVCDYIVSELRCIITQKRPTLLPVLDTLLAELPHEFVAAPMYLNEMIHDTKDSPILNAALLADADIIVSGDHHFLELTTEKPKMMSVAQFWDLYGG